MYKKVAIQIKFFVPLDGSLTSTELRTIRGAVLKQLHCLGWILNNETAKYVEMQSIFAHSIFFYYLKKMTKYKKHWKIHPKNVTDIFCNY